LRLQTELKRIKNDLVVQRERIILLNGPTGAALRCESCDNIPSGLYIVDHCQHRVCGKCFHESCQSLLRVRMSSPAFTIDLPLHLQVVPDNPSETYLKELHNHLSRQMYLCPVCCCYTFNTPAPIPILAELAAVASRCVGTSAPFVPVASLDCYFCAT